MFCQQIKLPVKQACLMILFKKGKIMTNRRRKIRKNCNKYHSKYYTVKRINIKNIMLLVVALILISALVTKGVTFFTSKNKSVNVVQKDIKMQKNADNTTEKDIKNENTNVKRTDVSIVAVGDNLVSDSVLYTAQRYGGGKYDFSEVFEKMKPDFKAADIAIINQETMLGGSKFPYQGYPLFNTPNSMGKAIMDAGFDIVQCATNHSMDTKVEGMQHAIKYWKKHKDKVMMVGLNENEEEYNSIPIYECKGIKFAVLNYAYGLNGFKVPDEYLYIVNLMDKKHWNKVKSDIERAEKEADFTIVLPHWGQEYVQPEPIKEQVKWANMMVKAGADLIIGTHPHVCEKIQWIKADNGNKALCYYSLGNYTSGQQQWETLMGGMATLTVRKDSKGTRIVKKTAGVVPTINHYVWGKSEDVLRKQYTYKLKDYDDSMLREHSIQWYDPVSYSDYQKLAKTVFGKFIKNK